MTDVGHSAPVFAAVFDGRGDRVCSVGKSDRTLCVWKLLRPEDEMRSRWIHDKYKARVADTIRNALTFIRLGMSDRMGEALASFLYEWDVAKSSIVPEKLDPVVKRIMGYKTNEIMKELSSRGIDVSRMGLTERDELAARLCTAVTTPETMTVQEIRSELQDAKVPSKDVFERERLLELLKKARQEGTEFARPIPFSYEKMAPEHEEIIARARVSWNVDAPGRRKTKLTLAEKQASALDVLNAVVSLDLLEAKRLGVELSLRGLVALIQFNRAEIAGAIARGKPYEDVVRKGIDINNIKTKDPNDVDWLISGPAPDTDANLLKKGGQLYELAVKSIGGTLLPGQCYTFKDVPGRVFEYIRYDEQGSFRDMLCERRPGSGKRRIPKRIPGFKTVRWGAHFFARIASANAELAAVQQRLEALENGREAGTAKDSEIARLKTQEQNLKDAMGAPACSIKAQSVPADVKQDSQQVLPTAYLYQAPVPIPRLHDRLQPSIAQVVNFFSSIDACGFGSVSMPAFEEAVGRHASLFERFGMPMHTPWVVAFMKELVFAREMSEDEAGDGAPTSDSLPDEHQYRIQGSDLVDFVFTNVNMLGHLIFKIKLVQLEGDVKIGLIDCSRIPVGSGEYPLASDWAWKGFPTWYIDAQGGLYRFGEKVGQANEPLQQGETIVADIDQDVV